MSFAVPAAMFLAALAVPIIGLYILKVRLRRITTSTNLFWKQLFDEKPPRSIWQQLRHLLSLLAQLLLLLLLVLAVADPYFSWQFREARRIVLVIDHSASMRAEDVGPSRLEAARQAAHAVIDGLRFRDEVAVVAAAARPQVLVGMTGHVPTLRRAVDRIQASDDPTLLDTAVELARQLIADHPHGQVIVFTDGCIQPADRLSVPNLSTQLLALAHAETPVPVPAAENADVVWKVFSTAADNVGITQLQVRRSLNDPLGYEVMVTVMNAAATVVRCRLELTLDGIPVDVMPLTLQAGERWSQSTAKTSLEGGTLLAELTQIAAADSAWPTSVNMLDTDDRAWAVLPPRKVQNILIVTPGNLFLQKVFEANPLVSLQILQQPPDQWPQDTLLVLHQQIPDIIPPGNVFVIDPLTDTNLWKVGGVVENPIVTDQNAESPLMTHIRLDNLLLPETRALKFLATVRSLAGTLSGDTVYAEVRRTDGRCLVLNVNLERSDLAFRTVFPILVTNALAWFAGESGELQESVATGMLATFSVEQLKSFRIADSQLKLRSPSGRVFPLPLPATAGESVREGESNTDRVIENAKELSDLTIGPLDETGIWSVALLPATDRSASTKGNSDSREANTAEMVLAEYAVNLASERETDLRPPDDLRQPDHQQPVVARWFKRRPWYLLTALASLLIAVEWFLYQRRLIS